MKTHKLKKISALLPRELLEQATSLTDMNQTEVLIAGLQAIIAKQKRLNALEYLGKIDIRLDFDSVRERRHL